MASKQCPCGSGQLDDACCLLYIDGVPAPTAEALMRSRYTAYVRGAVDYLITTHDPATRNRLDRRSLAQFCRDTGWLGLEIVDTEKGSENDNEGVVEFIARGVTKGAPFAQRERSRFRKVDGQWLYVDGAFKKA